MRLPDAGPGRHTISALCPKGQVGRCGDWLDYGFVE